MIDKNLNSLETIIKNYIDSLIYEKYIPANMVYDKLREYINKLFSDMNLMIEFSHLDKKKQIFLSDKKGDIFPIKDISTGERTLFTKILSLYLSEIKDSVILIDEPELSLHPAWQNRVLKLYENFANKNNCQIIIATHSPHIIGSAKSEYIRLLVEEDSKIEVIDNLSNSYGAKFSQILTDIMGVKDLRTPEVNEKFTLIENMIANNQFDTQEFKKKWQELEEILGKNYFDLKLLKLEIASRKKDVQNN
jgi:predicted ATP-binding protein involved in virulence